MQCTLTFFMHRICDVRGVRLLFLKHLKAKHIIFVKVFHEASCEEIKAVVVRGISQLKVGVF